MCSGIHGDAIVRSVSINRRLAKSRIIPRALHVDCRPHIPLEEVIEIVARTSVLQGEPCLRKAGLGYSGNRQAQERHAGQHKFGSSHNDPPIGRAPR
jgi:hypothetical protein